MNQTAIHVLTALGTTSLLLSLGAGAFILLLRILRVRSPTLCRTAWATVLLLGWLYVPISIAIPWYKPAAETASRSDDGLPPGYAPLSVGASAPVSSAPLSAARQAEAATDSLQVVETKEAPPQSTVVRHWPEFLASLWLLGMVGLVGLAGARYWRFIRSLSNARASEPEWQSEWNDVLSRAGVRRSIPLCVAGEFGPALCVLPRGFVLFVPSGLWRGLDAAQREAILVHELAHFRRGDVWKSLLARLAALPHWFNPLAWYAVRRFEEAGEWACDDAVRRAAPEIVTPYAQALLSLGEVTGPAHALSTAARGRELPVRVRRLLTGPLEDSKMKKFIVSAVAVLIVLVCAMRFELVAQETEGDQAPANAATIARAQEMVDAAQKTYEAVVQEYEISRVTMDYVSTWSRKWLDAELLLIGLKQRGDDARLKAERSEAFAIHLKRMERLHEYVAALNNQGAQGGEAGRLHAAEFFAAEAKLWAEGSVDPGR
jgi:beta-lactamase regulating signal transducer with metallopeptidase domain